MNPKLGAKERFVERYASSRVSRFITAVRQGWNSYSFIFYIGSISAILGGVYNGWAAVVVVIITIAFFYFAGIFNEDVEQAKKRNLQKRKSSK